MAETLQEDMASRNGGQDPCADAGTLPALALEHALALEIIEALADEDSCRLDHNGNCQAHATFGEGECPHATAKAWLERNRTCEKCGDQTIRVGPRGHVDCIACNPPLGRD